MHTYATTIGGSPLLDVSLHRVFVAILLLAQSFLCKKESLAANCASLECLSYTAGVITVAIWPLSITCSLIHCTDPRSIYAPNRSVSLFMQNNTTSTYFSQEPYISHQSVVANIHRLCTRLSFLHS